MFEWNVIISFGILAFIVYQIKKQGDIFFKELDKV